MLQEWPFQGDSSLIEIPAVFSFLVLYRYLMFQCKDNSADNITICESRDSRLLTWKSLTSPYWDTNNKRILVHFLTTWFCLLWGSRTAHMIKHYTWLVLPYLILTILRCRKSIFITNNYMSWILVSLDKMRNLNC